MVNIRILKNIIFSIGYWILASILYTITRYGAIEIELDLYDNVGFVPDDIISAITFGLFAGIFLGLFESYESMIYKKRKSFTFVLSTKTGIYILIFYLGSLLQITFEDRSLYKGMSFIFSRAELIALVNFTLYSFLFHFVRLMNKSMGPGILFEYLIGKYFNPREEERIFLFIDLKSSTTIAEKIGHKSYSSLIQECFMELTKPILKFQGHVYQYVGDEVVVTWEMHQGIKNLNCIHFFYSFLDELKRMKNYFINKFEIFPEFKAGMSSGWVTVAEVGELKSEISYHGDVLNTASRLQGLCNDYGKKMLISESIYTEIEQKNTYNFNFIGNLQLKGKKQTVKIYAVEEKERI